MFKKQMFQLGDRVQAHSTNSKALEGQIGTIKGCNRDLSDKFPDTYIVEFDTYNYDGYRTWQLTEACLKRLIKIELKDCFRNVDNLDWDFLFNNIITGSGGYDKFWRSVMTEVREALKQQD